MSAVDLEKIYERAKAYAARKGFTEHSEDFAQEASIRAFELGFAPNLEWLFAGFLRKEHGDSRTGCGRTKQRGTRFAVRLDAPVSDESDSLAHDLIGVDPRDQESGECFDRFVGVRGGVPDFSAYLKGREKEVYELVIQDELLQDEAAILLGVTHSRVSQILRLANQNIARFAMLEDMRERVRMGDTELSVRWVEL